MSFCFHLALFLPLIRGSGTVYVVKYELVIVSFSLSQYVYIITHIQPNVNRVMKLISIYLFMCHLCNTSIAKYNRAQAVCQVPFGVFVGASMPICQ